MSKLKSLWLGLIQFLTDERGEEETIAVEQSVDTDESGDNSDAQADTDEDGSSDAGDGNQGGKDRAKFIPRERFDEVNAEAQKLAKLKAMGVLEENEDGELRVNADLLKPKPEKKENADDVDFRFDKSEVDDASWPFAEKINKGWSHFEKLAGQMAFFLNRLASENAILRDYPEFLQKESPLRKKAMEILKSDPEFKKMYKGNPEASYWAVKRAAELLSGVKPTKPLKKPKSSFIIGKGESGKTGKKMVPLSSLTSEQLDELERNEFDRLSGQRSQK